MSVPLGSTYTINAVPFLPFALRILRGPYLALKSDSAQDTNAKVKIVRLRRDVLKQEEALAAVLDFCN